MSYEQPASGGPTPSTSVNEREFTNPIYGEDETRLPDVQKQFDNPTYGLNEEECTVATEAEQSLIEQDMSYESQAYESVPN